MLTQVEKQCSELSASFPSRLTYFWVYSLIWTGFKRPLDVLDLWSLNQVDRAKEIVCKFEKYFSKSINKISK